MLLPEGFSQDRGGVTTWTGPTVKSLTPNMTQLLTDWRENIQTYKWLLADAEKLPANGHRHRGCHCINAPSFIYPASAPQQHHRHLFLQPCAVESKALLSLRQSSHKPCKTPEKLDLSSEQFLGDRAKVRRRFNKQAWNSICTVTKTAESHYIRNFPPPVSYNCICSSQ